jgi:hypothetical protein
MMNLFKSTHQPTVPSTPFQIAAIDWLSPVRQRLNGLQIRNAVFAHLICRVIPATCPFERDFCLAGRIPIHIPPLCKLNPLYEETVGLRFRALCYLNDERNTDVRRYC